MTILCPRAENWPYFRGLRGDGTSAETNVPVHWKSSENISWKVPLPGEGHSSPTVWDKHVFLTAAKGEERLLIALDANTGRILWQKLVATSPKEAMHRENSSASSTPITDGKYVFSSFQIGDRVDLRCFDFTGKEIWAIKPLQFEGEHGYSYTPAIYQDLLIFDCRQEGEAATLGIERQTGKIRWKTKPGMRRISHIPPLVIQGGARDQVIVSGSNETCAYNPATGELIWRAVGPSDVAVAGLTFGEGKVFTSAGYPSRTRMAIDIDGRGDVTESHVAWKINRQATYVPSAVYHRGYLYSILDEGMLLCFDAKTGESRWEHRLGGRHRSSLILANGNIYATNDKGVTTVFAASPEGFKPVSTNHLDEFCYTTPAISNGRLYLRTDKHLWCIQNRDVTK